MINEQQHDLYEKHIKIQNRWISGFYQNIRSFTIWITLAVFFLVPWLRWDNRQAILFDISARKFHFFNLTFWPQDFYLLLLLVISAALGLIVVTNLAGRIWCGYTCPQTVWTKCFMWLEYMLEGDRARRLKRDRDPWHASTIIRRIIKHFSWLFLSYITAATFVGYFIPVSDVLHWHLNVWGYFWVAFFTLATYMNAGWMREQVCLFICPYARFQSVMFDRNTMIVSYDYHRGEPRGSLKESRANKAHGDCIDCELCVQVCPTGIDIRNGLQMACIGCAACIDACNTVMDKVKYPRGLIRYHTENALDGRKTRIIRPRLIASLTLLMVIFTVFVYLLVTRIPLQFVVQHDHRNLYRHTAQGTIENTYVLTIDNMTEQNQVVKIEFDGSQLMKYVGQHEVAIPAGEATEVPVTITIPANIKMAFDTPIIFHITSPVLKSRLQRKSNFFTPQ